MGGQDFTRYTRVPEEDEDGTVHHERADNGHLLKRITQHTRVWRYQAVNDEAIDGAVNDREIGA